MASLQAWLASITRSIVVGEATNNGEEKMVVGEDANNGARHSYTGPDHYIFILEIGASPESLNARKCGM